MRIAVDDTTRCSHLLYFEFTVNMQLLEGISRERVQMSASTWLSEA